MSTPSKPIISKDELEKFVDKQTISGEEIYYLSSITERKPKISLLQSLGILALLVVTSVLLAYPIGALIKVSHLIVMVVLAAFMVIPFLFLTTMVYKKTPRQLVAVTNIRFLIFLYGKDLIKMKAKELEDFKVKKEIAFDAIENLKLPADDKNTGVLIMVFEEENEEKNGYVKSKLHLEVEDCEAVKKAVPPRLRPDASKDDYWERTYRD